MEIFITVIITSLVWIAFIVFDTIYGGQTKLIDDLDMPYYAFDDMRYFDNKAEAIKEYIGTRGKFKKAFWNNVLPDDFTPYVYAKSDTPDLSNFIKAVKFCNKDLAILNKKGDIEIIV